MNSLEFTTIDVGDVELNTDTLPREVKRIGIELESLSNQFVSDQNNRPYTSFKNSLTSPNYKVGNTGWKISENGDVEFNNGTFQGSLAASTIDIGGNDATSFHVDIDGNMWLGSSAFASAPIKISNAGIFTLTGGTSSISIVNGANTIGFTPSGTNAIFAGTTGSPQFKVTPAGALTATGATISGAVTITGGSGIANLSDAGNLAVLDAVGTSQVDTTIISGGKIVTGLLTASNIQTGTLDASTVTVTNINASNISTGTLNSARITSVSLAAVQANISTLSTLRADLGTITAGIIKVSTSIAIQKSDATAVAYLGQDPDSLGIWGFIANRGYGLMCKYTTSDYGRIFVDSGSTDFIIDMPSFDKIKIQDAAGNAIARFHGRSASFTSTGGLDLFGPIRLYTVAGDPSGTGLSQGMISYNTSLNKMRVYDGSGWRTVTMT